ncbi:MAG: Na+ dependent nucleoside transporter [Haliscomenobacter sp.]|nr:nucleoside transporter C-terminal domain-containing protein [Haliscomenobacter sp.]MBK9490915.1 Na+ dependent nucleoside transporter [Haliscomenobacter sp.]
MELLITVLRCLLGMAVLMGICYAISSNRKAIHWRTIGAGIALQFLLAFLILKVPGASYIFDGVASFFQQVLKFSEAGATFLFGDLVVKRDAFGYIFAFQVLPTIVFFSSLTAVLFHLGILQRVVYGLAWLMNKVILLTASVISAPAAIVASKLILPETEEIDIKQLDIDAENLDNNLLDAIARGTTEGLRLAVNVGAMLLVFTAMVFMLNQILLYGPGVWFGINDDIKLSTNGRFEGLTFSYLLGLVFAPLAWLMGTPYQDITLIGQLLGMKTMINEFVAYGELGVMKESIKMDPKSILIATYALCGFSNFASIGIQIGGIGALAPGQRKNLTELGIRALIAGSVACFLTACVAGLMSELT